MTITVELPPEIDAHFLAQAISRGLSLDPYVQEFLSLSTLVPAPSAKRSPERSKPPLAGSCDLIPGGTPPLSDYAMSRESFYTLEDDVGSRLRALRIRSPLSASNYET